MMCRISLAKVHLSISLHFLAFHLSLSTGIFDPLILKLHTPTTGQWIGHSWIPACFWQDAQGSHRWWYTSRKWHSFPHHHPSALWPPSSSHLHNSTQSLIQAKAILGGFYIFLLKLYTGSHFTHFCRAVAFLCLFHTCIFLESKCYNIRCETTSILSFRYLPAKKLYQQKLSCTWSFTTVPKLNLKYSMPILYAHTHIKEM